jgi:hypothetical protein
MYSASPALSRSSPKSQDRQSTSTVQIIKRVVRDRAVVISALGAIADRVINVTHRHATSRRLRHPAQHIVSKTVLLTEGVSDTCLVGARYIGTASPATLDQ